MSKFEKKVVLVTGAARGIGKTIAQGFSKSGAHVVIADRDEEKGQQAVDELTSQGGSATYYAVDLALPGSPQEMIRSVVSQQGRLDVLVNNARSGDRVYFLQETEATFAQTLSVTLTAVFFASQQAVLVMNKPGSIINITSVAADLISPESASYHVAKAGLMHMTRYLAVQAGKYEVRVNAVTPGFIVQDEHQARFNQENNSHYQKMAKFSHPLNTVGSSEDIAQAVLFLASPEARFITGHCLIVDGGLTIQEQSGLLFKFDKEFPSA